MQNTINFISTKCQDEVSFGYFLKNIDTLNEFKVLFLKEAYPDVVGPEKFLYGKEDHIIIEYFSEIIKKFPKIIVSAGFDFYNNIMKEFLSMIINTMKNGIGLLPYPGVVFNPNFRKYSVDFSVNLSKITRKINVFLMILNSRNNNQTQSHIRRIPNDLLKMLVNFF